MKLSCQRGAARSSAPPGKPQAPTAPLLLQLCLAVLLAGAAGAQTHFATLVPDGAWTWYNDPRAVFHHGILYVGYVRNSDGMSSLSAFNPQTGLGTHLWGGLPQKDDHNNPGLLVKQDGTLLALYARHGANNYFAWRLSSSTNPISPADWTSEQTFTPNLTTNVTVTYSNPYQLAEEGGTVYSFLRNLNFNPNVITSTDGGATWSPSRLLIQKGSSPSQVDYSKSVYVKYASNFTNRIDFLYTDGHPRNVTNSLYHAYYRGGALYRTDGSFLKRFSDIPLLHDSGERGSVIYQYSTAPGANPNDPIPLGRAWCWEIANQGNGAPVCVFTVQSDDVTPGNDGTAANFSHDRIYYYYARWTGTNWQKRFIAHAGRPLYASEDDYAGGICLDPQEPTVVYLSTSAAEPFNLSLTNTALRANTRYELFRGVTGDGGLTFAWTQVTSNSPADNLRPYIPRRHGGPPTVLWFRGTYTSMHTYNAAIVGLFSTPVPQPPTVSILSPRTNAVTLTNLSNCLLLGGAVLDDGLSGPLSVAWTTVSGPTNARFSNAASTNSTVGFPAPGSYVLRLVASNAAFSNGAELCVQAGANSTDGPDPARALWLKFDEFTGALAADSSGNTNTGTLAGGATWQPAGGVRAGAVAFDGSSGVVTVPDAPKLDNTSAFTLAYWFRANAYPPDSAGLVSKRENRDVNNSYTTYLKASDQRLYVDIDQSNDRFASTTTISTGLWYHVALVFDGALAPSERAQLWLNGRLDVTATETSAAIPDFPSAFQVGYTASGLATWFNGLIDDVRFYRRALSPGEILALTGVEHPAPSVAVGPTPAATNAVATVLYGTANTGSKPAPLAVSWTKISGPGAVSFGSSNSQLTRVTFHLKGPYTLRLSASNSLAAACQDMLLDVRANPNVYEDWISSFCFGSTNSAELGIADDPDGDGEKNLVEFALGLSPAVPDASPFTANRPGLSIGLIQAIGGTHYLVLQMKRPLGRLGIRCTAEVSGDLRDWTEAVQAGEPVPAGNGMEIVVFRDLVAVHQAGSRFIRLRVTRL